MTDTVEPKKFIRPGITASALAHISFLGLVLFFAEVHPFASVTAEPIAVDLVTPDEAKTTAPEPPSELKPADISEQSAKAETEEASPPSPTPPSSPPPSLPPSSTPPPAASPPAKPPAQQQSSLTSSASAPSLQPPSTAAAAPTPSPLPAPAYAAPQPDLSVKYHVLLGLPQDKPGDGFDAAATQKAAIASDMITAFRQHLRQCSRLPNSIAPTDKIEIKLRVLMTPDGRLATEPALIEASASEKGPALMRSAIDALQACQPYAMLPADKYREWKILDLKFTPQDFASAS